MEETRTEETRSDELMVRMVTLTLTRCQGGRIDNVNREAETAAHGEKQSDPEETARRWRCYRRRRRAAGGSCSQHRVARPEPSGAGGGGDARARAGGDPRHGLRAQPAGGRCAL